VNAVLYTPALPDIAHFFIISSGKAQQTMTWFLIGYTLGQLLYGPIANRFGRKPALYAGISLQIISSLLCVLAGVLHSYLILVLGRFLLALGSAVGLKMTFTLVNEVYEQKVASQKLSYLIIAFAITPGIGVMLGGILTTHFGWISTFYACAVYGSILLFLVTRFQETKHQLDFEALKLSHLVSGYTSQFTNIQLIAGGLLMGSATCFVYVFAALAPFITINLMGMSAASYGAANLLPPLGMMLGSILSAQLAKKYQGGRIIRAGIIIALIGTAMMWVFIFMHLPVVIAIFVPMMFLYCGLSSIVANASAIAMGTVSDKAHGSAVMNFLNMGLATVVVLILAGFSIKVTLLPTVYTFICMLMVTLFSSVIHKENLN
jgi:MFS family permease